MSSSAVPRNLFAYFTTRSKAEPLPRSEDRDIPFDDEALMARVQTGDMEALGVLFDRYSRLVFGVAARILRDVSEAEEIVQDTFIYIYNKGPRFDPMKGSFRSWLVHIVYCQSFNRRDYLNARRFYSSCDIADVVDSIPSNECVESNAQTTQLRGRLKQAFSELNERQRRTLELFFFEGHSLREISSHLDEPLGNVRNHYYRGLNRLREVFTHARSAIRNGSH